MNGGGHYLFFDEFQPVPPSEHGATFFGTYSEIIGIVGTDSYTASRGFTESLGATGSQGKADIYRFWDYIECFDSLGRKDGTLNRTELIGVVDSSVRTMMRLLSEQLDITDTHTLKLAQRIVYRALSFVLRRYYEGDVDINTLYDTDIDVK